MVNPIIALRLSEPNIPDVMIMIPINASMGGMMWEKISEL
jgi:hypothetical protein